MPTTLPQTAGPAVVGAEGDVTADAANVREALDELRARDAAVAALLGEGEIDVELHPRADSYGEPAVYVDVFIPDDTPDDRLTGAALGPINNTVFDAIYDGAGARWPYVQFSKRSESPVG